MQVLTLAGAGAFGHVPCRLIEGKLLHSAKTDNTPNLTV